MKPDATKIVSKADLVEMVRSSVAEALEVTPDHIGDSVSFFELGLDSMQIIAVKGQLERQLSVKLPNYIGYEYPSVVELSAVLWENNCASGDHRRPSEVHGMSEREFQG